MSLSACPRYRLQAGDLWSDTSHSDTAWPVWTVAPDVTRRPERNVPPASGAATQTQLLESDNPVPSGAGCTPHRPRHLGSQCPCLRSPSLHTGTRDPQRSFPTCAGHDCASAGRARAQLRGGHSRQHVLRAPGGSQPAGRCPVWLRCEGLAACPERGAASRGCQGGRQNFPSPLRCPHRGPGSEAGTCAHQAASDTRAWGQSGSLRVNQAREHPEKKKQRLRRASGVPQGSNVR